MATYSCRLVCILLETTSNIHFFFGRAIPKRNLLDQSIKTAKTERNQFIIADSRTFSSGQLRTITESKKMEKFVQNRNHVIANIT